METHLGPNPLRDMARKIFIVTTLFAMSFILESIVAFVHTGASLRIYFSLDIMNLVIVLIMYRGAFRQIVPTTNSSQGTPQQHSQKEISKSSKINISSASPSFSSDSNHSPPMTDESDSAYSRPDRADSEKESLISKEDLQL